MREGQQENQAESESIHPEDCVEAVLRARREEYMEILRVVTADAARQKRGFKAALARLCGFLLYRLAQRARRRRL